ncbi:hypothetical protein QVD17_35424 [Tagetes erecta]|uniref:Uncharacterized protein n=1 Tax=Tagetes erecta TaxID=13708 RepID=A0AAD8K1E7_TARER|nr:hypothetical protein QVD17_35424 [Tagetes erecta]
MRWRCSNALSLLPLSFADGGGLLLCFAVGSTSQIYYPVAMMIGYKSHHGVAFIAVVGWLISCDLALFVGFILVVSGKEIIVGVTVDRFV